MIAEPKPYAQALDLIGRRTPIGAALSSEEWSAVPLALRDRAFFSARVLDVGFLGEARKGIIDLTDGTKSRAQVRTGLMEYLGVLGADRAGIDNTDLRDIRSEARLNLIIDMGQQEAAGYARWKQGQDATIRDEWPALELVRVRSSEKPRDWEDRWTEAGGRFHAGFGSRMIALRNDPIWTAISRFGKPWPPFDFGSGMGVESVDRETAIEAGLMEEDDVIPPDEDSFNDGLEASLPSGDPYVLRKFQELFGDDVAVSESGRVTWTGDRLGELYKKALTSAKFTPGDVHRVGLSTPDAIAQTQKSLGVDLTGYTLEVRANELRHAIAGHGKPGEIPGKPGETRPDQKAITIDDVRAIPQVWRAPQTVAWGRQQPALADKPPAGWRSATIQMSADLDGQLFLGEYIADAANKVLRLGSMWKKK